VWLGARVFGLGELVTIEVVRRGPGSVPVGWYGVDAATGAAAYSTPSIGFGWTDVPG